MPDPDPASAEIDAYSFALMAFAAYREVRGVTAKLRKVQVIEQ